MTNIKISVVLNPNQLHKDYQDTIRSIIERKLQNKTINNIGTITNINKIQCITGGKINTFGSSIFSVIIDVDLLNINVNDIIKNKISNIDSHGFYVCVEKQEIFSLYDDETKISDVNIGDDVILCITKVKYNIDKKEFVIISKRVQEDN